MSDVDGLPVEMHVIPFSIPNCPKAFSTSSDYVNGWNACREAYAAQCRAKGAEGDAPLPRELAGKGISLSVTIAYPGSRVSDIKIGNTTIQIPNSDIRSALCNKLPPTKPAASVVDFVRDIAENGLRHDLTPCLDWTSKETICSFWQGYMRQADTMIRERATVALSHPAKCPHMRAMDKICDPCARYPTPPTPQDIAEGKALDVAIDEHCEQQAGQ